MADDEPKVDKSDTDDTEKPSRRKRERKDAEDVADRLVSRYGTERAALLVMADESIDYRETIRELKTNALKEGERKLTADESKQWDAFLALGKSPKELTATLTEADTLRTENAEHKASITAAKAAKAINSEKPQVLAKILKAEGYRLELREDKDGDETTEVAYAVKGDAEPVKLTELIEGALSDYKPALVTESQPAPPRATGALPPQPPKGTAPAPKDKSLDQIKEEKRATGAYSA